MIQKLFGLGVLFLSLVFSTSLPAENSKSMNFNLVTKVESQAPDSLKWSVVFLNKILYSCNEWYLSNNQLKKPIQGVLNYAENDPLDTVVTKLHRMLIEGSSMYSTLKLTTNFASIDLLASSNIYSILNLYP